MNLPTEILDKIWLLSDEETLKSTRELQNEYVKKITESFSMYDAARNGNLENMRWLKENNCPWGEETFGNAAEYGDLENM
ncbi:hypothetical protein HDV06_001658, partial [Boothiomyces sp. JEL0866]